MIEPKSLESPSLKVEMSRKIGNAELAPHFFVIQPSLVFQPDCCVSSLLMDKVDKGMPGGRFLNSTKLKMIDVRH